MGNELFRELAGFGSANGSLGAAIPVDGILVPGRVELIAGRLKWEMASGAGGRVLEPPEGLLDLFMGLGEKDDEAIVSFASHYGMIMPSSVHPSMGYTPHGSEPIDIWRDLARRAKALINLAAAALQPRPVFELRDLDVLSTSNPCSLPAESDADENLAITGLSISRYIKPGVEVVPDSIYIRLEEDDTTPMLTWVRDVVAFEVSEWLRLGRVSVRVYPDEVSGWEVYTDFGGNLLGALALQMAIAVTRAGTVYTCSGCGRLYARRVINHKNRRPNPGCNNFCPQCKRGGAVARTADLRRRARVAKARQLAADGLSAEAVAQALKTKVSTARKWIETGK